MSLDVYLKTAEPVAVERVGSGIFIRENGETKEISEKEWNILHPDNAIPEPAEETATFLTTEVFHANITHNLGLMAKEAGLYDCLWRPDEHGFEKASQLLLPLSLGLLNLLSYPDKYKALNPDNGWGTYEKLRKFVTDYLKACIDYPDADVEADR